MKLGCKAEGAAQGYTVLGGIVLILYALQRIINNVNSPGPGTMEGLMQIVLGVVLILVVALAFDACGFTHWKLNRSGLLLALLGFIAILIASWPGITLDPIAWLQSLDTLAGFMILLAGILIVARS
ncbi:MAG: hypothetical protein OEV85_04000 [Candidatus Thorarchaeota archaeon]|nr:hypothetical protein [Candidatus Thorarchaeota archaeon]